MSNNDYVFTGITLNLTSTAVEDFGLSECKGFFKNKSLQKSMPYSPHPGDGDFIFQIVGGSSLGTVIVNVYTDKGKEG